MTLPVITRHDAGTITGDQGYLVPPPLRLGDGTLLVLVNKTEFRRINLDGTVTILTKTGNTFANGSGACDWRMIGDVIHAVTFRHGGSTNERGWHVWTLQVTGDNIAIGEKTRAGRMSTNVATTTPFRGATIIDEGNDRFLYGANMRGAGVLIHDPGDGTVDYAGTTNSHRNYNAGEDSSGETGGDQDWSHTGDSDTPNTGHRILVGVGAGSASRRRPTVASARVANPSTADPTIAATSPQYAPTGTQPYLRSLALAARGTQWALFACHPHRFVDLPGQPTYMGLGVAVRTQGNLTGTWPVAAGEASWLRIPEHFGSDFSPFYSLTNPVDRVRACNIATLTETLVVIAGYDAPVSGQQPIWFTTWDWDAEAWEALTPLDEAMWATAETIEQVAVGKYAAAGIAPVGVLTSTRMLVYRLGYNESPHRPIITAPADGSAHDTASQLAIRWAFSDPDDDSQGHRELRRTIGAEVRYWDGSAWVTDQQKEMSGDGQVFLPAGWGVPEGPTHAYAVRVWDENDNGPSPWSAEVTVQPSRRPEVTITEPASGATVRNEGSDDVLRWTVAEGVPDAYRVETLDGTRVETDSGWIATADTFATVPMPADVLTGNRTWRLTVRNQYGLVSEPVTVDVVYAWTPPGTPAVSFGPAGEAVTVVIAPVHAVADSIAETTAADIETRVVASAGVPDPHRPDGAVQQIAAAYPISGDTQFVDDGAPTIVTSEYRARGRTTAGRLSGWSPWAS